jgi:GxxExxY protein
MEVHRVLGPGFSEKIYEEALAREFDVRKIPFARQMKLDVPYKNWLVGEYFLDMVVDDKVILELKAVPVILPLHCAQALSYLKVARLRLAIVLNFGAVKLTQKRIVL